MGPLHTQRQRDFVVELCGEASDAGAEVREFGEYACDPERGNYMRPALVLAPDHDLRIVSRGAVRAGAAGDPLRQRGRGDRSRERHLVGPVLVGVVDGRGARDAGGAAAAHAV